MTPFYLSSNHLPFFNSHKIHWYHLLLFHGTCYHFKLYLLIIFCLILVCLSLFMINYMTARPCLFMHPSNGPLQDLAQYLTHSKHSKTTWMNEWMSPSFAFIMVYSLNCPKSRLPDQLKTQKLSGKKNGFSSRNRASQNSIHKCKWKLRIFASTLDLSVNLSHKWK